MEESNLVSGMSENTTVQIRGKGGNEIPTWCDACGPWNSVTEMALRMKTLGMTRPGNQNADREVSRARSRLDSSNHKWTTKRSRPCAQRGIN